MTHDREIFGHLEVTEKYRKSRKCRAFHTNVFVQKITKTKTTGPDEHRQGGCHSGRIKGISPWSTALQAIDKTANASAF